MSIEFFEKYLK